MKIRVFLIMCALSLMVLLVASPVLAFDTPTQDTTTNATDVLIWYGNNLTIDSANITIENLEDALMALWSNLLSFVLALLVTVLALWSNRPHLVNSQKSQFLLLLAVPVDLVYGLALAAGSAVKSPQWVEGVIVAIIGTFCLVKVVLNQIAITRSKKR